MGIFFLCVTFLGRISEFGAIFHKFQIIVEHSIFVVSKRLPYEKLSIFHLEYDTKKMKSFAQVLSDLLKYLKFKFYIVFEEISFQKYLSKSLNT